MDKWNEEFEIDEEILERFQRRMNAMKEFMRRKIRKTTSHGLPLGP